MEDCCWLVCRRKEAGSEEEVGALMKREAPVLSRLSFGSNSLTFGLGLLWPAGLHENEKKKLGKSTRLSGIRVKISVGSVPALGQKRDQC